MTDQTTDRALISRIASHTRWAAESDRSKATAPARRGLEAKWEREANPDGTLPPAEVARRVEHLRQAHMNRMALASVRARREKAAAHQVSVPSHPPD